jgi:hypothetical protein
MKKKEITPSQNPAGKEEQGSKSNLWKRHGIDDVYFQREAIVNFLSILGGVAVGALLTQFFPMIEQVRDSRWQLLLFFAASILILINLWIQMSWGTLVLKWPISIPLLIPQFMTCFSTCIMCLLLTNPSGWMVSVGIMFMFGSLNELYLMKTGAWEHFSQQRVKVFKTNIMIYLFSMVMTFLASAHLYFYPSKINEIIWGVVALLASIGGLIQQHQGMEQERKEFGIP